LGGISGVYLHNKNCFETLIQSTFHLQHRGTESSAIDTSKSSGTDKIRSDEVKKVFSRKDNDNFKGRSGIGSVSGSTAELTELTSSVGEISLVFEGRIINSQELREEMKKSGDSFVTGFESEIIGRIISKGKDIVDGIKKMNEKVIGSYTIGILNGGRSLHCKRSSRYSPLGSGGWGRRICFRIRIARTYRDGLQ